MHRTVTGCESLFLFAVLVHAAAAEDVPLPARGGDGSAAWRFSDGPEFPGARGGLDADAQGVLHLRFDFSKGGNYVAALRDLDPPVEAKALAFRVRKPEGGVLSLRVVDAAGQTFQKPFRYENAAWQPVEIAFDGWAVHWGGANDGERRPPVRSVALLVDSAGLAASAGEVLVADVVLRPGRPAAGPSTVRGSYRVTDFCDGAGFAVPGGTLRDRVLAVDARAAEASLTHSISLFGAPRALRLKARGTAGASLLLRIGSHFQTFERGLGTLDGTVQAFEVPAPPEGWAHRGGNNDGKVIPPLRLAALVLRRGTAEGPLRVELGELRCETEAPRARAVTLLARMAAGEAAGDARPLAPACAAWNILDRPVAGTLTVTVRDWESRVLQRGSAPWTLPADGAPVEKAMPVAIPAALNFADAEFVFEADGVRPAPARAGFVRPADDAGDPALRPDSPWGMGLYLYRYPMPGPGPGGDAMDRAAALAQAAGVKWSREEFSWGGMEPRPGEIDFRFYDAVVDTARRHGISVYGLLAYWSRWTKPYTEEGIDDWCRWARAVVRRYKDRVHHWEVYNEPNIFFWTGPKELYPVLLQKAYAAIKAEDADAKVLGFSTAGVDLPFIKAGVAAGALCDIVTVHPYRHRLEEDAFMRDLRSASLAGNRRPVWITEVGWSTEVGGSSTPLGAGTDERSQAQYLARAYLAAAASGAAPNVSWYDFRCDGTDPFYNEQNFGVVRRDLTPKPAYRALTTVCRTLASGTPKARTDFGAGIHAVEMGGALAVWSPRRSVTLSCRAAGGAPSFVNLMGEPLAPARDGERWLIPLRAGCPVFAQGAVLEPAGAATPMEEGTEAVAPLRF